MNENTKRFAVLAGIVFVGIISRLVPHIANVVPLTAIALFAGAYFLNKKWALIIPISALFISDFILQIQFWTGASAYPGFHSTMIFVYCAFVLIVGLGYLLKNRVKVINLFLASIAASTLFFLITNLGSWLVGLDPAGLPYTKDIAGLTYCFELAIPFFRAPLIGDLLYTGLLFGLFELLQRKALKDQLSPVRVRNK